MVDILGVHGVGNFLPGIPARDAAAELGRRWQDSLGNIPGASVSVAYYAHLLCGRDAQGDVEPEDLPLEQQELIIRWVELLGCNMGGMEGYGTLPVRQAMQWLAERTGFDLRLVRWFTARFFTDVVTYFGDVRRRREVGETLRRAIAESRPRVVIAHSFGSVVAYEALWEEGPDIELLVTLGSPLGMPGVVFEKLLPQPVKGRGLRPNRVLRWVNVADPGDLIALPRGLGQKFEGLTADLETVIGAFEFHRVARYLASPATRDHVSEVLLPASHA
jgi:hypothetical protein